MVSQVSLTDLAKNIWGQENILKRKNIGLELYQNGFEFLNSKPMSLNDFDVLLNQIDRKSNFVLKNLLYLMEACRINLQESSSTALYESLFNKTEKFGYGTTAPLLKQGTNLWKNMSFYENKYYTLKGNYSNSPDDTRYWQGFLIIHANSTNHSLLTIINADPVSRAPEVWHGFRYNGGWDYIDWYKVSHLNYSNSFTKLQKFNDGLYDAKTQIGLTGKSKLLYIKTDKDLTNLPLGSKFLCNIKDYDNSPLAGNESCYVERIGTRDIDETNGIFTMTTPFFESGNIQVFYGALSNDINNNKISWRQVSFLDNEHNFSYLDKPNTFSKTNSFTDIIGGIFNGCHTQKINDYDIYQSSIIQFQLPQEGNLPQLKSNIYIEKSSGSSHLVFNITNSDLLLTQMGEFINEGSGFYRVLDKKIQQRPETPVTNILDKLTKVNVYFYQSLFTFERMMGVDVDAIEKIDSSLVKKYQRVKKLHTTDIHENLKMFDYDMLSCLNTSAINQLVKSTGIGIGPGFHSKPSAETNDTIFYPTTYKSISELRAGFSKTVLWDKYVGVKPPLFKSGDIGQLTFFGANYGTGSLLYTTTGGQWGPSYIGLLNSQVRDEDEPGREQIVWLQIPSQHLANVWHKSQTFNDEIYCQGNGIGGNDLPDKQSQSWIDIGKHKKAGGSASLCLWAQPNEQTFILTSHPNDYGDTHYHTKRNHVFHSPIFSIKENGTGQNGGTGCFIAQDHGNNVSAGVTNNGGCFVSQLGTSLGKFIFYFSDLNANYSEGRIALCPFDENLWKTWSFRNNGNAYSWGGSWINGSDKRIKENIKPIDNALDKIKQINAYSYNRIDQSKNEIGVIAQEIEKVFPEAVELNTNEHKLNDGTIIKDMLGVNYGSLTAVAIQAIKELTQQVEDLKRQVEELKNGK